MFFNVILGIDEPELIKIQNSGYHLNTETGKAQVSEDEQANYHSNKPERIEFINMESDSNWEKPNDIGEWTDNLMGDSPGSKLLESPYLSSEYNNFIKLLIKNFKKRTQERGKF